MEMKKLNGWLLTSLMLVSCAKERPFEEVYKDPLIASKASIDTNAEFLYVPNSQGVPRFTSAMAPFVQGKEKIVKFSFKESGLVAYQMDESTEFSDNPLNNKPVLTIPVTYKSFRCRENSNDECTNAEEENTELQWFEKDRFIPTFEKVQIHEADSVGLPDSNDSCFFERDTRLVHREVTAEVINFELEKTYEFSKSPGCIEQLWYNSDSYDDFLDQLDDNGAFHARIFFSFVKLDTITDKKYEKIDYPVADQGLFGFFKTSIREKNVNRETEKKFLMNRWSPNKDVVDYYLSDEFAKPENEYLKRATHFAFDRMNKTLEKGGVKLKLKLHDADNRKAGDLRNSMIVLIEDLASPLLGYGPTVANPRTGEIIQGHVNMYKGSLESYAPYTYDSLRFLEEQNRRIESNLPEGVKNLIEKEALTSLSVAEMINSDKFHNSEKRAPIASRNFNPERAVKFAEQPRMRNDKERLASKFEKIAKEGNLVTDQEKKALRNSLNEVQDKVKIFDLLSKNSVYTVDMFNFDNLGKEALSEIDQVKDVRDEHGRLKAWDILSINQQRQLTEILVTHAYVPTLVHEMGHNLGLRHNFAGSVDKANFYDEHDHRDLGIRNARYSSIMDYAYSSLNELSTLGPYDVAALKFAYNHEVKMTDDSVEPVKGPLFVKEGIKAFRFCTDENAGSSLTCNRFDEGTDELEIAKHMVESYESAFQYRNLKGRRKNFNDVGAWRYLISTYNRMMDFRSIHESWQGMYTFLQKYNLQDLMLTGCSAEQRPQFGSLCPMIDRINAANTVVGRYMLDIVKAPDLTCHLEFSATQQGRTILKDRSLFFQLSEEIGDIENPLPDNRGSYHPTDCFGEGVQAHYQEMVKSILVRQCTQSGNSSQACNAAINVDLKVLGQAGQFHNDVDKANRTDERNLVGDLEIRGIWLDKLLAMDVLTNRELMTTAGASNHLSFEDLPEFKAEIVNLIRHLSFGESLQAQVPFRAANGTEYHVDEEFNVNVKTKVHRLKNLFQRFFDFPDYDNYDIGPVLLSQAANASYESLSNLPRDIEVIKQKRAFRDSFTAVYADRIRDNSDFGSAVIDSVEIPGLDKSIGATESNTLARELISRIKGEDSAKINEIKALIAEANKPVVTEEVPAPAPETEGEVTPAPETEGEVTPAPETETTPAPTPVAEDTTVGTDIAEKVMASKVMLNIAQRDVNTLQKLAGEVGPDQIQTAVEKAIGKSRAAYAIEAFMMNFAPAESELEEKLRNYDLIDLKLATGDEEDVKSIRDGFKNGLLALPAR